jgi:hypothetical protein
VNVLIEVAIEIEEQVVKKSTPAVKKPVTTKEKHVVVLEGSPLSTRRSARLMK